MAPLHVSQSEKKTASEGAALIFEDEASFRQDSTLYQTWAPIGSQPQIPVTGQRKSVKIFGAVEIYTARFTYHRASVFNAETYLVFLEQLARRYYPKRTHLIQDNASYHKDATVWSWFKHNRALAGSPPTPRILTRTECDRTALASHQNGRDAQSLFCNGRGACGDFAPGLPKHPAQSDANPRIPSAFLLIVISLYLCAGI